MHIEERLEQIEARQRKIGDLLVVICRAVGADLGDETAQASLFAAPGAPAVPAGDAPEPASRERRSWKESEDRELRTMFRLHLSDGQIADRMNRTQSAIRTRRSHLGLIRTPQGIAEVVA